MTNPHRELLTGKEMVSKLERQQVEDLLSFYMMALDFAGPFVDILLTAACNHLDSCDEEHDMERRGREVSNQLGNMISERN